MPAQASPRLFLSYARRDGTTAARALRDRLTVCDLAVWHDLSALRGGTDWWRQVEAALCSIEHVVWLVTPGSLASPWVAKELQIARREGAAIVAVLGPGSPDLDALPVWAQRAHVVDTDIPEQWTRLLADLGSSPERRRVPVMAPPPPQDFVARPQELAAIESLLLGSGAASVAITTVALRGAGGFGKTALAQALAWERKVMDHFHDGILWVTLGEAPTTVEAQMDDLVITLRGSGALAKGRRGLADALASALDDRRCLLVIDDAWRQLDLEPFLVRGPRDCTVRLLTTRFDAIVPRGVHRVPVDEMTLQQSVEVLAQGLEHGDANCHQARLVSLARRLGRWPQGLAQVGRVLWDREQKGQAAAAAIDAVEAQLETFGLPATVDQNPEQAPSRAASATFDLSLARLDDDAQRERFRELAVFAEDASVSLDAVAGLWARSGALDRIRCDALWMRLSNLSLLRSLDLGRGVLTLHDVVRKIARERLGAQRLRELDGLLCDHWIGSCGGDWSQLADATGQGFLPAHLWGAGRDDELRRLLLDPAWMACKLRTIGLQPLLADYRALAGDPKRGPGLVGRALELAAPGLARDPGQLAAQLLGRLEDVDGDDIALLRRTARASLQGPALVPAAATLERPGGRLWRVDLGAGPGGSPTGLALVPTLNAAVLGDMSGGLRLLDLRSGQTLLMVQAHEGEVGALCVDRDGYIVSAGHDGWLRRWRPGDPMTCDDALQIGVPIWSLAAAPGGELAVGCEGGWLAIVTGHPAAQSRRWHGHEKSVVAVAYTHSGVLVSAANDGSVSAWAGAQATVLQPPGELKDWIDCLLPHERPQSVIGAGFGGRVVVWDTERGSEEHAWEADGNAIQSLALSPSARWLAVGSTNPEFAVWSLDGTLRLPAVVGHDSAVVEMAFVDEDLVLSVSDDGCACAWSLCELEARSPSAASRDGIEHLAATRDHIVAADDWQLRILAPAAQAQAGAVEVFQPHSLALSPDGRAALVGDSMGAIHRVALDTGAVERSVHAHESWVTGLAVVDGRRLVSAGHDGVVRVTSLATGRRSGASIACGVRIQALTLLSGGRRCAIGCEDDVVRLVDLGARRIDEQWPIARERSQVLLALPDGRLAAAGFDGQVEIWSAAGERIGVWPVHEGTVTAMLCVAGGALVASASHDRTVRIWSPDDGRVRAALDLDHWVTALALADAYRLLAGDGGGHLHELEIVAPA